MVLPLNVIWSHKFLANLSSREKSGQLGFRLVVLVDARKLGVRVHFLSFLAVVTGSVLLSKYWSDTEQMLDALLWETT